MGKSTVTIDAKLVKDSGGAILVDDGDTKAWLPKSVINYEDDGSGNLEIEVPEWLAIKEELV